MPSKPKRASTTTLPQVPIAAVFSFLKETRGVLDWDPGELATTLKIKMSDARRSIDLMEIQGYVKPAGEDGRWLTTMAGENVSSSAAPHFAAESVERALSSLQDRMRELNQDSQGEFAVTEAVAFGDFLSDRPRVQAADVGIQVIRKRTQKTPGSAAQEHGAIQAPMKILKNKSPMLQLRPYENWMGARTHRRLL